MSEHVVSPEKWAALKKEMEEVGVLEKDLKESFVLGSGSGGQKIQKTHSAVHLKHLPSNLEVQDQSSRLRENNRYFARKKLLEKVKQEFLGHKTNKMLEREKRKKQKKRRQRRSSSKN